VITSDALASLRPQLGDVTDLSITPIKEEAPKGTAEEGKEGATLE
jgi:hypothetical protein